MQRVPSSTDRRAILVVLTDAGRSLVASAAASFDADVLDLLSYLPGRDRAALQGIVSRLLVSYAACHGVDLFAGLTDPGPPAAVQGS